MVQGGLQTRGLTPSEMLGVSKFKPMTVTAVIQSAHAGKDAPPRNSGANCQP